MLLDRIWPVRRGQPVEIEAPPMCGISDLVPAGAAVTDAVLSGDVTPEEGSDASCVLVAQQRMIRSVDLERRIRAIEEEGDLRDAGLPSNRGRSK
jgi:hypothetical protein